MKKLDEWLQHYATTAADEFDLLNLIRDVRREAFERCREAATQAAADFYSTGATLEKSLACQVVAERISKVYREEGER